MLEPEGHENPGATPVVLIWACCFPVCLVPSVHKEAGMREFATLVLLYALELYKISGTYLHQLIGIKNPILKNTSLSVSTCMLLHCLSPHVYISSRNWWCSYVFFVFVSQQVDVLNCTWGEPFCELPGKQRFLFPVVSPHEAFVY